MVWQVDAARPLCEARAALARTHSLTQSVTHFAFGAIVDFQPRSRRRFRRRRSRDCRLWSYITPNGRQRSRSRTRAT